MRHGLILLVLLGAAGCTPMSEQGWIRIKGAAVESDGRAIENCRLDLYDAATDQRKVGQELVHEGRRFDIQLYPGDKPATSYYIVVKCPAFNDDKKLGPFDTTGPEWTQPLDLGDIVFRRIPG